MTERQRPPLQVVVDAGEEQTAGDTRTSSTGVEYIDGRDEWRAESVIRQWAPEHQLIGALMYLSADNARAILELVVTVVSSSGVTRPMFELVGCR